jgi:hypothetical protein
MRLCFARAFRPTRALVLFMVCASPASVSADGAAPPLKQEPERAAVGPSASEPKKDETAAPLTPLLEHWAHEVDAQKNRVTDEALSPELSSELLSVLARGVSSCDCFPRKLRWAWAMPTPRDREHPMIVVAFNDPPRVQDLVASYLRIAQLRFAGGRYIVTSAMALKRPAMSQNKASLEVRVLPRRDLDEDGQLDIVLHFAEHWPSDSFCGTATFASSSEQLAVEQEACTEEEATTSYP